MPSSVGAPSAAPQVPTGVELPANYVPRRCRRCGIWSTAAARYDQSRCQESLWGQLTAWGRGGPNAPQGNHCLICKKAGCLKHSIQLMCSLNMGAVQVYAFQLHLRVPERMYPVLPLYPRASTCVHVPLYPHTHTLLPSYPHPCTLVPAPLYPRTRTLVPSYPYPCTMYPVPVPVITCAHLAAHLAAHCAARCAAKWVHVPTGTGTGYMVHGYGYDGTRVRVRGYKGAGTRVQGAGTRGTRVHVRGYNGRHVTLNRWPRWWFCRAHG